MKRLNTFVVAIMSYVLLLLIAIVHPTSAAVSGKSLAQQQTSATIPVTFTFEDGGIGANIEYGSLDPQGFQAYVQDGFVIDVRPSSEINGLLHWHETDSILNDKVPDRSAGERGVLLRDSYPGNDPLFFAPVNSNTTFSLESLVVGTTSADGAATTGVQVSAFLQGQLLTTVILVTPLDGYVPYSGTGLGTLSGLKMDRLEFIGLSGNQYAYYLLDDVVLNTAPNYRLPFVGKRDITNGPGCGTGNKQHTGFTAEAIDYAMPIGTSVYASEAGKVTFAGSTPPGTPKPNLAGFGIYIVVEHADGSKSYYAHLSQALVISGNVTKGQLIAYSGDSGKAKGAPHLHFQIMDASGNPISIRTLPDTTWKSGDPNNPCDRKPHSLDGFAIGPPVA